MNTATDVYAKRILTVQVFIGFLHKVAVALVGFTLENPTRGLLEVPGRFGKRDGNALSMAPSELENKTR